MGRYLRAPVRPSDVVHGFSGVRSLHDDGTADPSAVTRDYVLELRAAPAPVLSVFGGKITTYRRLAEHALDRLLPHLAAPRPAAWTGGAPLPGGDLPGGDFARFLRELRGRHPWLPPALSHRLARAYGTRAGAILADARGMADLGEPFGGGLTEAELRHMMDAEWARTAEDALWRRSKLGLHLAPAQAARVAEWMRARTDAPAPPPTPEHAPEDPSGHAPGGAPGDAPEHVPAHLPEHVPGHAPQHAAAHAAAHAPGPVGDHADA